ncbi:MAG: Ig-like domain-containing protein [Acutalibacteraceae bacterium]|nr:Ig-like domain-containing protein [Acutalibacteraceae bacterium]
MLKRFTLFILSVVIAFNTIAPAFTVSAADSTINTLISLVKKFPQGKYWNHMGSDKNAPDKVTDTPCKSHKGCSWKENECSCNSYDKAIQCMGYAYKIAYEITGASARTFEKSTTLKSSSLRVGDVIRFNNDGHSICVTGIDGNEISYTDCNWDYKCGIRWGVTDISYIKSKGFTYVLHLKGNNRKNTDLDFYKNIKPEEEPDEQQEDYELWQMNGEGNLNIRKTASVSASIKGKIPAGAKYKVYSKKSSADYLWGKVDYNGVEGWAALNYSEYVRNNYDKPEFIDVQQKYLSHEITLQWKAVSGAEKYKLEIFDENGKTVEKYETENTKYTFTLADDGVFSASVTALNGFCESWENESEAVEFTVKQRPEGSVMKIELSHKEKALLKGKSFNLTAKALPDDATDKTLVFKSGDESVATVTEDGVVTAADCGITVISCETPDGEITSQCLVTVTPDKVKNPGQSTSKTTTGSIRLNWDKLDGADGYYVKRYDSSKKEYIVLSTVQSNSYTDKTVKAGKYYYYKVCAYVKRSADIITGEEVKVKLYSDPSGVKGLKQSASSSGTVTLKWSKVAGATGYVVYKYDSKSKEYVKYKTTSKTSIKLSQKVNSSVKYRVRAVTETKWGNLYGSASSTVTATTGPKKVTAKLMNAGTGKVKISWNKVSSATHYQIYRLQSGEYKKIATVKSKYTAFTNTSLKRKTTYKYKVRAIKVKDKKTYYGSFSDVIKIKTK